MSATGERIDGHWPPLEEVGKVRADARTEGGDDPGKLVAEDERGNEE
jgi:hypothetical protein